MRRRRLLTGLSAASVASALPNFTFGSSALAQGNRRAPRLIARLGHKDAESDEYPLFLKSTRTHTFYEVLQVRPSQVRYDGGHRQTLHVSVTSTREHAGEDHVRRIPPTPSLTLNPGSETHVASLYLYVSNPRDELGRARIHMSLGGRRFRLPQLTLML